MIEIRLGGISLGCEHCDKRGFASTHNLLNALQLLDLDLYEGRVYCALCHPHAKHVQFLSENERMGEVSVYNPELCLPDGDHTP